MIDVLIGANTSERVGYYLKLLESQTFKDFRVVCLCKEEIKDDFEFEFKYIREKGHKFWPTIKSMRHAIYKNELLLHAEAKYILLWDAWQIPSPELLAEHIKFLEQGYGVEGPRTLCSSLAQTWQIGEEIRIMKKDIRNTGVPRLVSGAEWWNCNASAPLQIILDVNGFDMRFAGGTSGEDCDIGLRLERAGLKIMYNPLAGMYHPDHDIWKPNLNRHGEQYHISIEQGDEKKELKPSHCTFKFRNSMSWDPATSGDDDLMEDEKFKCWYDKWGLKRWRCKQCGEEGLVDSVHLHKWNDDHNIIRTPLGLTELKSFFGSANE